MRRKLIIICALILYIVNINLTISKATTTGKIYLSSNKTNVDNGEQIEITVNIEGIKTAAYNANLHFDETKVDFISGPDNINVIGNKIILVWFDNQAGVGAKEGNLCTFVFRAKENGIANFTIEGEFFSQKGQLIKSDYQIAQIQIGKEEKAITKTNQEQGTNQEKTNNKLQTLRIDQEGLIPNFEPEEENYFLTTQADKIDILAIPQNPEATVEITGNSLKEGLNTISIKVTSQDNTQSKTYKIEVTKTKDLEAANTNLEILAIENNLLNPVYDNNIISYNTEISNSTTNLNILAIPENEKATVKITGTNNIKEGNNSIIIDITAANGITKKQIKINAYKRNTQEEEIYQEKQSHAQEKLEEGYKIQKLSTTPKETDQTKQKENLQLIILSILLLLTIAATLIIKKKKIKIRNKRIEK